MPRSTLETRRQNQLPFVENEFLDSATLTEAFSAHGPELHRFATRYLGDRLAAQDVVQEVFLRAWRAADSFAPELASLRVWLFAIARNIVFDELRRGSKSPVVVHISEEAFGDSGPCFDELLMDSWVVEEALRRGADNHRQVIVHIYLRGRSFAEVADDLGIPLGTLRSRLFYGLRSLRSHLANMGVNY